MIAVIALYSQPTSEICEETVLPSEGCCPSAARAHFTTTVPQAPHLSEVLPASGCGGVVGAQTILAIEGLSECRVRAP